MLAFDEKGHLAPYKINELTLAEFEAFFVDGLDDRAHRRGLFADFLKFSEEVKANLKAPFFLWVDGSYITTKEFPADIDVVVFLDYDLSMKNLGLIRSLSKTAFEKYRVDAHFASLCKWNHRFYESAKAAEAEWLALYSFSRPMNNKKEPKGIIKINF